MYTNKYYIKWSQGLSHWGSEDSILAYGLAPLLLCNDLRLHIEDNCPRELIDVIIHMIVI